MTLKSVKRYVRFKRLDGVLEIVDTQFDAGSMFSREYKIDEDNKLFVGTRHFNRVDNYICIGEFLSDSDTLFVDEKELEEMN